MNTPSSADDLNSRRVDLGLETDEILDSVAGVFVSDPDDFVRRYVQKGGQGWSSMLDPAFFVGAVSAGVAASATWAAIKASIAAVINSLIPVSGPSNTGQLLTAGGELDPELERMLRQTYINTRALVDGSRDVEHDLDEAEIFHHVLFFQHLLPRLRLVELSEDHFRRLNMAAKETPERLSTSQLVARIVERWLREHPNSGIGLLD